MPVAGLQPPQPFERCGSTACRLSSAEIATLRRRGAWRQLPSTTGLTSRVHSEAISVVLLTSVPAAHWPLRKSAAQSSSPKHEHRPSVHSAVHAAGVMAARHIEAAMMPAAVPSATGTSSAYLTD